MSLAAERAVMNTLRFLIPAAAGAALVVGAALPAAAASTTTAQPDSAQTQPDTPVRIPVLVNDTPADGYDLTPPIVAEAPQNGSVATDTDSSRMIYTPASGFQGTDVFAYTVCDTEPTPTCADATVTVVIAATPEPGGDSTLGGYPYAAPYALETQAGEAMTVNVLTKDFAGSGDLDPASFKIVTQPSDGSASLNADGTLSYTPANGFTGTDSLVYQVCNTEAVDPPACDDGTVSVTVDQTAAAPSATPVATVAAPTPAPTTAPESPTAAPAAPTTAAPLPPSTGDTQPATSSTSLAWLIASAALLACGASAGSIALARRRHA